MYIIYSPRERLYWSNEWGWVDRRSADTFSAEEQKYLNLPIGGKWVAIQRFNKNPRRRSRRSLKARGIDQLIADRYRHHDAELRRMRRGKSNPRRHRYSRNGSKYASHPIVRQIVDRLHVGAPDSEVAREVKAKLTPGTPQQTVQAVVRGAIAAHHANRRLYMYAMGGNPRRRSRRGRRRASNPTVARWESKSGKHWVDLYEYAYPDYGFFYKAPGAGGQLGKISRADAIAKMEEKVRAGYFQPDSAKTPMRRVKNNPRRQSGSRRVTTHWYAGARGGKGGFVGVVTKAGKHVYDGPAMSTRQAARRAALAEAPSSNPHRGHRHRYSPYKRKAGRRVHRSHKARASRWERRTSKRRRRNPLRQRRSRIPWLALGVAGLAVYFLRNRGKA